jgi:hypothetical protein
MDEHPKKYYSEKTMNQRISSILEDDQIRLLFIVILIIGFILLITGFQGASIFLIVGLGLVSILCIFKSTPETLIENFICESWKESDHVSYCNVESQNFQFKFRNSTRNKK